jgi:hypothetical protein
MGLLLASCPAAKAKVSGFTLTLPPGCWVSRMHQASGRLSRSTGVSYEKLGASQSFWPAETYVSSGYDAVESIDKPDATGRYLYTYNYEGACRGTLDEVLAHLRRSIPGAGLQISVDHPEPASKDTESGVQRPAGHALSGEAGQGVFDARIKLTLYESPDLGGWVYFRGTATGGSKLHGST